MKYILLVLLLVAATSKAQEPLVTFDFVDAPLSVAVEHLAKQAGKRVRVDRSVNAVISLSSRPIPWSQALALIKSHFDLEEHHIHDTLWLKPHQEKKQIQNKPSQPTKTQQHLQEKDAKDIHDYSIKYYHLEHYPVNKILGILTEKKQSLFAQPIFVQAETDQNMIMARATTTSHQEIERLIQQLDTPSPRIHISSRIIIAKDQATNELGFRLGGRAIDNNWGIAGGNSGVFIQGDNPLASFSDNLILDLGLNQAPAGRTTLGFQDGFSLIELELQALESSGKIDIVATPQITVRSGAEATIATGTEIPYSQVVDNNVDIFFKEALLKLEVTPTLVGDNRIHMNIVIRLDNIGQQYNGIPSIDTNKLDTQVTLHDGETLVLGGIFRTVNTQAEDKIPLLGDIPFFGVLFRHQADIREKAELLVFITPVLDRK